MYTACVEDPETIKRIENDGLYADEVVLVVCTGGRVRSIVDRTTRRVVDLGVWVGSFGIIRV